MSAATYAIGDLARHTGTKVETIRWYERDGTMPPPARTEGGHRAYTRAHLDRLAFIRHARELGFRLDDVRTLLQLSDDPDRPCADADLIARQHPWGGAQPHRSFAGSGGRACAHGGRLRARHTWRSAGSSRFLADHSHEQCLHQEHGGTGL